MRATRRDTLKAIFVTAAAAIPGVGAAELLARSRLEVRSNPLPPAPGRASWLADLEGVRFAGSVVNHVGEVRGGAVAVTLTDGEGNRFVVDILRHDPATPGVARGGSLATYVNTCGRGVGPTPEEQGLAAMALAAELARREAAGIAVPRLVTLSLQATMQPSV